MATPTKDELAAAHGATIPDVVASGLDILFCGINPGLYSGHTGHHFARPGNRFWPALHRAGLTPRLLAPAEQHTLPQWGIGITNLVSRATARADELTTEELRAGGRALTALLAERRPGVLAVLGVTAYRQAFGRPRARIGPQSEVMADTPVWVLPNPSGLNAQWSVDAIAAELGRLGGTAPPPASRDFADPRSQRSSPEVGSRQSTMKRLVNPTTAQRAGGREPVRRHETPEEGNDESDAARVDQRPGRP